MDSDSESEDLLLDDEGVFDDFTVASSWERLISEIEATCRKWQTNLAEDCLVCGAEVCDGYGRLHKVHCDLNYGNKSYRLDFYFEVDKQGTADDWLMDCHHLQVSFGVQDFLVLAPVSMSGVILDAPEATLLLSAVSVALSNCGSIWPAFVPVHDPTRKAYRGIQGMRGPYCRSFEADRIGSQVPVKLMHLEGLYDLFISKLAFCSPDSAAEYDGKVSFSVRLTYHTPMPGFEISSAEDALTPTAKAVEGFDGDTSFKRQWDEEYPWAEWYTVDDPIKGFELIATWANRIAESSLDMAEFENISVFEADKWLLAPIMTQVSEPLMESSNVSFAYRMRKLFQAFSISKEAKFMGDFCTGDSLIMKRITSSTMVPPTSVLDRVLKSLLPEGEVVSTLFEGRRNHQIAQDVKGAPTNSLFAQFCLHAMWFGDCNICAISVLWIEFVREMRWYWEELQSFPRMPRGGKPDFKSCLVHQKLQLLAACIERKAEEQHQHTQAVTMKRLNNDNTGWQGGADPSLPAEGTFEEGNNLESQEGSLMLLRTCDRMRLPTTQKQPLMTEDMLLEREHALVVLGDSPSGKMTRAKLQASMLSSDMSAFKAANPRASFEDFIRWHSPRDWVENDVFQDSLESLSPSSSSNNFENLSWPPKGRLSDRMAHPDNSWIQLWESVDPVPADKQKPLFDHTREGEKVIHYLETLRPHKLLAQMICTAFSSVIDILCSMEISMPKALQVEINQLCATIVSILKPLTESSLSDTDIMDNMDDWDGDIEELCSLLERAEKHIILATSLYKKLSDTPRLFSALYNKYISVEKQKKSPGEVKLESLVSPSEQASIAELFPPVSLSQTQRRILRMGNFLNGHEPFTRELVFSHHDHYQQGQNVRYRMEEVDQWQNMLSHRMYIRGSPNDLQVAYSVVSND